MVLSFNSSSIPLVRKSVSNFKTTTLENGEIYVIAYPY